MNIEKMVKHIISLFVLVLILVFPYFVFAATSPMERMQNIAKSGGYSEETDEKTMVENVGLIIKTLLSLLGVIFLILILLGGYHWMTAGGDESKVSKAKDIIIRAVIGLVIIVGAYAISEYVLLSVIAN